MIESQVHAKNLVSWARNKPEVVVFSGDLTGSVEIMPFKETYPDRFFSLGMAEQNMLSWAGGMAREGWVPFLHTFAVFLVRRPYDQLAMSVCYPNLPVKLVGFLPGIMTPGGVTHQAIEDISLMRGLPNMTVLEVGDAADIESVLDVAHAVDGPVYIRMLRGQVPRLFDEPMQLDRVRKVSDGEDITIFSAGICTEDTIRAVRILEQNGVSVTHRHVTTHKPFNDPEIDNSIRAAKRGVITVENHNVIGGLGSEVAVRMAELGGTAPLTRVGIPDTFGHGASVPYLKRRFGIDTQGILDAATKVVGKKIDYEPEQLQSDVSKVAVGADQLEAL